MKLIDLVIAFIVIIIPFNLINMYQNKNMEQGIKLQVELNNILDTAVDDGVSLLVEKGDGHKIVLNKEGCIYTFYNTLFMNMDISSDEYAKAKVMAYIPVIIILDYDGYYALTCETFLDEKQNKMIKPVWYPKRSYTYSDESYVYGFTIDDFVTIYSNDTKAFIEGKQKDLKKQINSDLLQDDQLFDEVRRRTIIETLQEDISYMINKHNEIAKQFGISYQFSLPVIEEEDWYQSVDNIGMLVFFQGMPIGIERNYYNHYAFGGSQLLKGDGYYIQENFSSGLLYYHRKDCQSLTDRSVRYTTPQECALQGAFPCERCKP